METSMFVLRTFIPIALLLGLNHMVDIERSEERIRLIESLNRCFENKSTHWLNGAHRLDLKSPSTEYHVNAAHQKDNRDMVCTKNNGKGQSFLFRFEVPSGRLLWALGPDERHPEYQLDERYAGHRDYFEVKFQKTLGEVSALCEALELLGETKNPAP